MTSIELRGVRLDAPDGTPLLDGLDLVVADGATTVLCGPPGSGKTAALRVLVGLDEQTEGDVLIDEHVVNAVGPRGRDLALVQQDAVLHPHLDVHDNLAFATRLRQHDKVALAERIDDVAGVLALDTLLDARPDELGPAQRQRVAIGRALVRDALAHLFDEPFGAQPEGVRTHVRSVTAQWQRDAGATSLVTTSSPDEALAIADHLAIVHRGRVHQVGAPEDVHADPDDAFVAAFLGRPGTNLLPAAVQGRRLLTPIASIPLDDALAAAVGDRSEVLVGVRPEHCLDGGSVEAGEIGDPIEITSRIDDVEWRGASQLLYLGYDVDDEVAARLEELEDTLDADLFQGFFVAELSSPPRRQAGQAVRLVVPRSQVLLFDVETGRRLRTR